MMKIRHLAVIAVAVLLLSACGGGGGGGGGGPTAMQPAPIPGPEPTLPPLTSSNPEYHLGTARFTTHQPDVLEQIGAHHAYAMGLTGRGVRIGIDDTIVDYTQSAEFGGRVKLLDADGAKLSYLHPFGDKPFSDVAVCQQNRTCKIWEGNSQGDKEAPNSWVRDIVSQEGWPIRDDSVFVVDEFYSERDPFESLFRWREVPTPYGVEGKHGTTVASVAAGKNLGVAPDATIIPVAQNLSDDQRADALANNALRFVIAALPVADRRIVDTELASIQRNEYANFDIINRSYGRTLFDPDVVSGAITAELRWFGQYLPRYLDAALQADRPDAQKTILVYSAGNDGQPYSGLGADFPYWIPELRGHSLAVAATDPRTGVIASYSNRCGPVPPDWDAARHGPHYCLVAPGTVRGLVTNPNTPGQGDIGDGLLGTSYAAPIVSGSLALLMEHFRGTRGNTAIVKRMLDTADRSGRYADLETYGAGHLDLEAALMPVGTLTAGQSAHALSRTTLQVPTAFGSVAGRVAGVELAAFDDQDFPFWVPMSALVSTRVINHSPIPIFEGQDGEGTPVADPNTLGLHWMPDGDAGRLWLAGERGWMTGFGPASASLAHLPDDSGWGHGLSLDNGGYLATETSGAFGSDLRSGMVWTSRAFKHDLGGGWRMDTMGTLALSLPQYGSGAIFQASPSVMSALSMRVGTEGWGFTVEQPLRAESGTGTFHVENGQIENGERLYDEYRIPLRPEAREVRMTLRHEREGLGGSIAMEASSAMNAGHATGQRDASIGFAYRMTW